MLNIVIARTIIIPTIPNSDTNIMSKIVIVLIKPSAFRPNSAKMPIILFAINLLINAPDTENIFNSIHATIIIAMDKPN